MADERVLVGDLTRKEFRERMQAGSIKAAIVPTAATEQHNEHLEMTHDTLHCTLVAQQAALRLLPQVVVTPTVAVGVSGHWMEHIGTLTSRPEVFCEYVFDICHSLQRAGVENILILNGHGGNNKPLFKRIYEYRDKLGINLWYQNYWDVYDYDFLMELMESKAAPGHASEFETSTMLHVAPERVHLEDMDNDEAKMGTTEKGAQLIEPAVAGVTDILRKLIAGERIDLAPRTFRDEGMINLVTGLPIEG